MQIHLKHILVIGQTKGFEHDSVSAAMEAIYTMGKETGLWDTTMRTDAELAGLIRSQVLDSKRGKFDGIIERAVRRGELPAGSSAELVEEVIPAMVINRMVIQGQCLDDQFATHVVDDIVLPLLHR